MGIDQDFPMTRTQVRVLVVGLLVMAVVGGVLFAGLLPGAKPTFAAPTIAVIDGESYYVEAVALSVPPLFQNSSAPQAFDFHNVTFELWVSNWYSFDAAEVHGNGTEPNGTVFSFALGPTATTSSSSTLYLSPDRLFGIEWAGAPVAWNSVKLLVRQ